MDDYKEIIKQRINESIKTKRKFLSEYENIYNAASLITECFKGGNKLLIFGNGGSAADAQHIAGELVGRYKLERKGLSAIALSTDTSILTALSNDYSFESVFQRQVQAIGKKGDVLFGISTSGNSKNVINALNYGKEIGTKNISLTGNNGGEIKSLSQVNINCYSADTARIQECHMLAYHCICEIVEMEMNK